MINKSYQNVKNKTFLEIVNRILLDTDGESVETLEGNILENTKRVCEWVNEGYEYCWKKMFQTTAFKDGGEFILGKNSCTWSFATRFYDDYVALDRRHITQFDNLIIDKQKELKFVSPKEFNRITYEGRGVPEYFTLVQTKLLIKPIPNEDHFIQYFGTGMVIPLVKNTDVPVIDARLLIAYGIFKQYCLDYNRIDNDSWYIFQEMLKAEITSLTTPSVTQNVYPCMKVESWGNE